MAEQADQTRVGSQLPGLLLPGLVPPLLGLLAFALLRESHTWFYGRYGVVPEDVGISQIRMLTGVLRTSHLWSLPIPGHPAASFLIVLASAWVLPRDRDVAGKRLQLRPGVVWRVHESDAVIQVKVNPPDAHAPTISDPHPSAAS